MRPQEAVPVKQVTENELKLNIAKHNDEKQPISTVKENVKITQNIKPNAPALPKAESVTQNLSKYEVKNAFLNNPGSSAASSSKIVSSKENDDGDLP